MQSKSSGNTAPPAARAHYPQMNSAPGESSQPQSNMGPVQLSSVSTRAWGHKHADSTADLKGQSERGAVYASAAVGSAKLDIMGNGFHISDIKVEAVSRPEKNVKFTSSVAEGGVTIFGQTTNIRAVWNKDELGINNPSSK
ncbi:hypothetical protein [Streptomyces sp. NPDC093589]|uniref:hypothetical protein n=1 Tax=Streptomyces sp. NPDC093589 TaxID=3366043 RepID=UPI00382BC207